jgi:hypothetical protein
LFIADEVKDSDPFKPNSDATKVIQLYWDMVAKRYLKESLTPIITLLTSTNKTISLEIDQRYLNKKEGGRDRQKRGKRRRGEEILKHVDVACGACCGLCDVCGVTCVWFVWRVWCACSAVACMAEILIP